MNTWLSNETELNWWISMTKIFYYFLLSISSIVGVNVCYKNIHILFPFPYVHPQASTYDPFISNLPILLFLQASDLMANLTLFQSPPEQIRIQKYIIFHVILMEISFKQVFPIKITLLLCISVLEEHVTNILLLVSVVNKIWSLYHFYICI